MANQKGRIFIDTSTTPYKGVEIADLQRVLGRGTGDLGLLCSDQEWYDTGVLDGQGNPVYSLRPVNRINKWAKFKPTRMAGLNPTDSWKGQQKNVYGSTGYSNGIGFVVYESLNDLRASANGIGWNYEPPRGKGNGDQGTDEWFRLLDFNGYKHNVESPFRSLGSPGDTYTAEEETFIAADFMFDTEDSGALDLSDFSLFNNWYFGVAVFCNSNPNLCGRGTAVSPLSYKLTDNYSACKVTMLLPARAVPECTLVPFFTNTAITWGQSGEPAGNHRYVPLPFGSIQISVVAGGPMANLVFSYSTAPVITYNPTTGRLQVAMGNLSVENTGQSTKSFTTGQIYYEVFAEKTSDLSTKWRSNKMELVSTGTLISVNAGQTESVLPATTKTLSQPSGTGEIETTVYTGQTISEFLSIAGGVFNDDYRRTLLLYYYDPNTNIYYDINFQV